MIKKFLHYLNIYAKLSKVVKTKTSVKSSDTPTMT